MLEKQGEGIKPFLWVGTKKSKKEGENGENTVLFKSRANRL